MTVVRVGGASARYEALVEIFDGKSAAAHQGTIAIDEAVTPAVLIVPLSDGGERRLTLESLRELPDQADQETMVLTSTEAPLLRVVLREMADTEPLRARFPWLKHAQPVKGKGRIAKWAVAAVASVALIIFVMVPLMADQLARVLPADGERALGDATYEQVRNALGQDMLGGVQECTRGDGLDAMAQMVTRLGGDKLELPYPLTVTVLDHPLENAFALPGGRVVFFRGLIDLADTPDEVAAVLAHEIGHVVAQDPTRIALRSAGSIGVLGLLFGDFAGGAAVLFLVNQLIEADYTREAEAGADEFAHQMLAEANVDAGALGTLFERLMARTGDAEGIAAHFMSHPALGDRIEAANEAALPASETRPSLSESQWRALQSICD